LIKISKRCNQPNELPDKEKAIISDGLSNEAPQGGLFSNQFWDELRVYATLNYMLFK
jgi:hypothetical protein